MSSCRKIIRYMLNGSSAVIFMALAFVISLFRGVKPGKVFFVSDMRAVFISESTYDLSTVRRNKMC